MNFRLSVQALLVVGGAAMVFYSFRPVAGGRTTDNYLFTSNRPRG